MPDQYSPNSLFTIHDFFTLPYYNMKPEYRRMLSEQSLKDVRYQSL